MRNLIVCNIVSLDGYYEGPGGDVMALPFDQGFNEYNAERLRAADTLLLGRKSYEGFKSYWPPVADNPDVTPVEREISRLNGAIEKVVVSDSLTPDQTAPWHNTRIIRRADAHEEVAKLKVDELHLMIGPGVLAAGTPAFESQPPVSLRLMDTRTWPDSSLVLIRYAVALTAL